MNISFSFLERYALIIATALATFFLPILPLLFGLGFLCVADWVLGIVKAKKAGEWVSKKMDTKVYDGVAYLIALLIGRLAEVVFDFELITKTFAAVIAAKEIKSIDENFKEITGIGLFEGLLNKIKKKTENGNSGKEGNS